MKKIISTLVAIVAAIACIAGLVACGDGTADPVAGKTYEFEKVEITKGASGAQKELAEAIIGQMFVESTLSFDENGTSYTMTVMGMSQNGTYTQDGSKLILNDGEQDQEAKVSGIFVKIVFNEDGVKANIVYKLIKEDTGVITSPKADVAGKTYVFSEAFGANAEEIESIYAGATIAFDNNGGFTMTVNGSPASGTYTETKTGYALTANGTTMNVTASEDELVLKIATVNLIFKLKEENPLDVAGKTFNFVSADAPSASATALVEKTYANSTLVFDNNGGVVWTTPNVTSDSKSMNGTYVQNGAQVKLTASDGIREYDITVTSSNALSLLGENLTLYYVSVTE